MYDWSHWSCSCWCPSTFFSMTTNTALWVLGPAVSFVFVSGSSMSLRISVSGLYTSVSPRPLHWVNVFLCSLFRFPFGYAISIQNSHSRFVYLGSQSSVSCLSIPVFQLFDCSIIPSPRFRLVSVLSLFPVFNVSGYPWWVCWVASTSPQEQAAVPLLQHFGSHLGFRITSVLGNVCSQFKIHSHLCFGSMSCRGFQFFRFPCLRFSSSLSFRFFSRFSFSLQSSVFSLQSCPVSVSVLRLGSSAPRFRIQIPVHPYLRYSVKVVHVFVPSNSGSSLFRLQCKGCPRLCFSSSCRSSCIRQSRLS